MILPEAHTRGHLPQAASTPPVSPRLDGPRETMSKVPSSTSRTVDGDHPPQRAITEFAVAIPPAPPARSATPATPKLLEPVADRARLETLKGIGSHSRRDDKQAGLITEFASRYLTDRSPPSSDSLVDLVAILGGLRMPRWCLDAIVLACFRLRGGQKVMKEAWAQIRTALNPGPVSPQALVDLMPWLRDELDHSDSLRIMIEAVADRLRPLGAGQHLDALRTLINDPATDPGYWPSIAELILDASAGESALGAKLLLTTLLARAGQSPTTDRLIDEALVKFTTARYQRVPGAYLRVDTSEVCALAHEAVTGHIRRTGLLNPRDTRKWCSEWFHQTEAALVSELGGGLPRSLGRTLPQEWSLALTTVCATGRQDAASGPLTVDHPVSIEEPMVDLAGVWVTAMHPGWDEADMKSACEKIESLAPRLLPGTNQQLLLHLRRLQKDTRGRPSVGPEDAASDAAVPGKPHAGPTLDLLARLATKLSAEQLAAAVWGHAIAHRLSIAEPADSMDDTGEGPASLSEGDTRQFVAGYYTHFVGKLHGKPALEVPLPQLAALSFALEHVLVTVGHAGSSPTASHLRALLAASPRLRTPQLQAMAFGLMAVHISVLHRSTGPRERLKPGELEACVEGVLRDSPDTLDDDWQSASQAVRHALQWARDPLALLLAKTGGDGKVKSQAPAPTLDERTAASLREIACLLPARFERSARQLAAALLEVDRLADCPREVRDELMVDLVGHRLLPDQPAAFQALHLAMLRLFRDPAVAGRGTPVDKARLLQFHATLETHLAIDQARLLLPGSVAAKGLDALWRNALQIVDEAIPNVRKHLEDRFLNLSEPLLAQLQNHRRALRRGLGLDAEAVDRRPVGPGERKGAPDASSHTAKQRQGSPGMPSSSSMTTRSK